MPNFRAFSSLLACAGLSVLAGCVASVPQAALEGASSATPPGQRPADTCNAEAASAQLLGHMSSAQVEQQALRLAGASSVRTLRDKQPITMEYNHGRLNLVVNAQGVIQRVYCG